MGSITKWAVAVIALMLVAQEASAEPVKSAKQLSTNPALRNVVLSPSNQNLMAEEAKKLDRLMDLECKETYEVRPLSLRILNTLDYDPEARRIDRGVWKVRYAVERCGKEKVFNAVFGKLAGKPIIVNSMFPGDSLAGYRLQKDTMLKTIVAAMNKTGKRNCKKVLPLTTSILERPKVDQATGRKSAWKEAWTFTVCGEETELILTFEPQPEGAVAFTVSG